MSVIRKLHLVITAGTDTMICPCTRTCSAVGLCTGATHAPEINQPSYSPVTTSEPPPPAPSDFHYMSLHTYVHRHTCTLSYCKCLFALIRRLKIRQCGGPCQGLIALLVSASSGSLASRLSWINRVFWMLFTNVQQLQLIQQIQINNNQWWEPVRGHSLKWTSKILFSTFSLPFANFFYRPHFITPHKEYVILLNI